jgi:hypothetical protein
MHDHALGDLAEAVTWLDNIVIAAMTTTTATAVIMTVIAIVVVATVATAVVAIIGLVIAIMVMAIMPRVTTTIAAIIITGLLVATAIATVVIGDVQRLADIDLAGVGDVIVLGQFPLADMIRFGDLAQGVPCLHHIAVVATITIVVPIAGSWCSHDPSGQGGQHQRQNDSHEQTRAAKPAGKESKRHVQQLLGWIGLTPG